MANHSNVHRNELSDPEISVTAVMESPVEDMAAHAIVGERFGKYLLVGEIATGGMAEIFLAVHKGLEGFVKVVVIKRVLQHLSSSPDFVQMFVNEARLAARLEHTNIVRSYEFGELDGQYFTVMEYLPGEDLCKALNSLAISKQVMPLHLAVGIVTKVCAGLHFAHEFTDTDGRPLNLVHRDINPANILITYGGEVKIIDFGVAKSDANQHTVSGTIKGKIAYMPPEQVLGRSVDRRADVFSAGIVLWELLTGRPLFLRDNEGATLYAVINAPIPPPSKYRPEVPPELDRIVLRALARTPAERYATAEQMANALDALAMDAPRFDPRVLASTVENLFGSTRAEAKRSISQTRSLTRNISLVMKLRSEVRADLVEHLDDRPAGYPFAGLDEPRRGSRGVLVALAAVMIACIAGGLAYTMSREPRELVVAQARPTVLAIDSVPPGAAVFVDGEPTGLITPAALSGLAARPFQLRLELPDYAVVTEDINVIAGATTTRQVTLTPLPGRLVLAGLPPGATVLVDGEDHVAGDVIFAPAGRHLIKILVDGRIIVEQPITSTAGDRTWTLSDGKLVTN